MNSIKENAKEMRLRWYRHMQRMEENNEVRAIVDMTARILDDSARKTRRMPSTEKSGFQEFGPLTST